MHTAVAALPGRDRVLAATRDHPYARLTATGEGVRGFGVDRVVAWTARGGTGRALYALGDAGEAVRLVADLLRQGRLGDVVRFHLPRVDNGLLSAYLPVRDPGHWVFRWAVCAPPAQLGEERVVALTAADQTAIASLLDRAHPGSLTRPGNPWVRRWYGVRDGGGAGLVACGADRSRGGAGELAGIAVDPERRGRGLGTALAAAMTRRLIAEYGVVGLGMKADRPGLARLYQRLGFTHVADRTSVEVA